MMLRDALISSCGLYRYWLSRVWDEKLPMLYFVMLNPSKADANVDDPTIRKCIGFATRNGYGSIAVLNLFAWRATDPAELRTVYEARAAVGSRNDDHIGALPAGTHVCLAWGAHGRRYPARVAKVKYLLGGTRWLCLKRLDDGTPAHPLMLPYSCKLTEYAE